MNDVSFSQFGSNDVPMYEGGQANRAREWLGPHNPVSQVKAWLSTGSTSASLSPTHIASDSDTSPMASFPHNPGLAQSSTSSPRFADGTAHPFSEEAARTGETFPINRNKNTGTESSHPFPHTLTTSNNLHLPDNDTTIFAESSPSHVPQSTNLTNDSSHILHLSLLDSPDTPNAYSDNLPRSVETLPPPQPHNLDWLVDLEEEEDLELEAGTDSGRGASVFTT